MVRLVRFFVQRVYQEPRELLWVLAVVLLLVCFHLDLAGRALTMTAPRYWSTVRALEVVGSVPIYGSLLVFLLGGEGSGIGDLTLIRFYVLHVAVLPVLALSLIYLHFSGIRRLGLREAKDEITAPATFHRHLLNLAILLVVLFGVLVSLAVLTPVPFNPAADPYSTLPGVGPPWYLLAPFGFLEWTAGLVPRWVAGSVLFLAFTALIVLPFWDRSQPRSAARRVIWGLALLILLGWVALTLYGARVA
jgi:quinol-cytochrome oxidoreductase complex cytochrome b subunit